MKAPSFIGRLFARTKGQVHEDPSPSELAALVDQLRQAEAQAQCSREEAAQALRLRSGFFSGASHDLRQRLHAIKLMAFTTLADVSPGDRSFVPLRRLANEIEALEKYAMDILGFARAEAGGLVIRPSRVQLHSIFHNADVNFDRSVTERHLALNFRHTTLAINTDAGLLQRIVENLVSNALKYTKQRVLVAARKSRDEVVIEVWDEGPGIAAIDQERIFRPFAQLDNNDHDPKRGAGLGLALVDAFCKALGYRISLKSCVGKGTVFRVHIPASAAV